MLAFLKPFWSICYAITAWFATRIGTHSGHLSLTMNGLMTQQQMHTHNRAGDWMHRSRAHRHQHHITIRPSSLSRLTKDLILQKDVVKQKNSSTKLYHQIRADRNKKGKKRARPDLSTHPSSNPIFLPSSHFPVSQTHSSGLTPSNGFGISFLALFHHLWSPTEENSEKLASNIRSQQRLFSFLSHFIYLCLIFAAFSSLPFVIGFFPSAEGSFPLSSDEINETAGSTGEKPRELLSCVFVSVGMMRDVHACLCEKGDACAEGRWGGLGL